MDIVSQQTVPLQDQKQKARRQRIWPAILSLYILAAIIPECVATYNTSPRSFLTNPVLFFFLPAFYGSANLLIRELMRRRPRSWGSILLLGVAFGCVNEGIVAGTWYYVVPDGYAMLGAVDWAWAVALTCFHTLFSVVIPIFLVEALFPTLAKRSWLKRRGLIGFSILFTLTALVGLLARTYSLDRLIVLLAVIVMTITAVFLPQPKPRPENTRPIPRLGRLRIAGCAGTILFFSAIVLFPAILLHAHAPTRQGLFQALLIVVTLAVCALFLVAVHEWSGRYSWGHPQMLALITGALLPMIILSLLLPPMWLSAQPLITLPFLVFLIWLTRRTQTSTPHESWASAPYREY